MNNDLRFVVDITEDFDGTINAGATIKKDKVVLVVAGIITDVDVLLETEVSAE